MRRELEKHLARTRQTADEEMEAAGGSKVRFSFEGRDSRQSLRASSNINSLHYDGWYYRSFVVYLHFFFILGCCCENRIAGCFEGQS